MYALFKKQNLQSFKTHVRADSLTYYYGLNTILINNKIIVYYIHVHLTKQVNVHVTALRILVRNHLYNKLSTSGFLIKQAVQIYFFCEMIYYITIINLNTHTKRGSLLLCVFVCHRAPA